MSDNQNQPQGLYARAAAPEATAPAVQPPQALRNALNALAGAGYPGIFTNGEITAEAKASFYLTSVDQVTVVAPASRGSSSQLALACATLGMAGALGGVIAYNTSFAKQTATKAAGIIPGVYGTVMLCGEEKRVKALVERIEADRDEGTRAARRGGASLPAAPAPTAVPGSEEPVI